MTQQTPVHELESMIHQYIEDNYELDDTTTGYTINISYIPHGLLYDYNYNKDEIAIQQVPGLTNEIKRDLITNFGLEYKCTFRCNHNYDYPTAYPYYMIFKIKKIKKLIDKLRYYGFTIISEEKKSKRKYNLPKYVSWDIRNTVAANKVWFGATLTKSGKHTNTAAKTVKEAMEYVAQNRLSENIWSKNQVNEYMNTYDPEMEKGYSVEWARQLSKSKANKNFIEKQDKLKIPSKGKVKAKIKRKYNLPKYICYDMAESRNREHNVFQTQIKANGKVYKNNLSTVKDATLWVMNKMVELNQWTLKQASEYLATYDEEMENGNFIPSNTPKSPCWRKREKNKNIKSIKEQISTKLKEILDFANKNNINVDINVK